MYINLLVNTKPFTHLDGLLLGRRSRQTDCLSKDETAHKRGNVP